MIVGAPHFDVLFEWGPEGASRLAEQCDVVVVVDVLSFTTTVQMAVDRGAVVYPFPWRDDRAPEFAKTRDAVLAVGRSEMDDDHPYSLAPSSVQDIPSGQRLVLPSPNGAEVALECAGRGVQVIAGCLRNARGAAHLAAEMGKRVGILAAGEQWPEGGIRFAFEDLVGAGSILTELRGSLSPDAGAAAAAFRWARSGLLSHLRACFSGRELVRQGFAHDLPLAAAVNVSDVAPVLRDRAFAPSM